MMHAPLPEDDIEVLETPDDDVSILEDNVDEMGIIGLSPQLLNGGLYD